MSDLEVKFWELKVENEKVIGEMKQETEKAKAATEKRIAETERTTRQIFIWTLPVLTALSLAATAIIKTLQIFPNWF